MKFKDDKINEIAEGNELSFKHFMEHHATFLFHYAIGFTKQKESAEEIVSDVFFEVWKLRKMLPDIENLQAWLCTITYRKSISYLRKNNGYDNISFDYIDNFFFEPVQSPDETIIAKEEIDTINKAIQMLPSKCRHIFFSKNRRPSLQRNSTDVEYFG